MSHKKTLSSGSQAYSLIVTGIGGNAYCASAPTSSADSKVNNFTLANINNTPAAGCTTYSDYTSLTAQLEPGKTYPLSLTVGTCGSNFNKIAKVFADWNGDGDFDDPGELIATTGVINATDIFNANITIPTNVSIGNYSRLRIVLTETTDPNAVTACGTYAKGETQDYRIQFIQPAIDAGIVAVNASTAAGVCAGKTNITVTIRNYGTVTLTSIPVTVNITDPNNTITTFNETYTGSLTPGTQADYTLNNTINTTAGATYAITAATNLTGDLVTANNSTSATVVISATPVASNLSAYYCTNTKGYQLSGTTDGGLFWYQNINDTTPIAAGATATTTTPPINNTYYAGINDFSGTVGPTTKGAFSGGGYNQFTPAITVSTQVPMVIESARLYIGNSGQITFSVADASGQIVSTTTIDAVATRNPSAAGVATDDPADQGKIYDLNLILPSAGTYTINISYDATATIFRSSVGVSGYPFTIGGGVFSITGNTATPGSTGYYYYLYNMRVHSYGCASTSRQAVTLTKPTIKQNGNVLTSNYTSGNQWYYNGNPITGATGQTFAATESGNYQVSVAVSSDCTAISDNYAFALVALHPDNSTDIGLTLYPIPASSTLNVLFVAKTAGDAQLSFINSAGKVMYTDKRTVDAGNFSTALNVSGLPAGTYFLRVSVGR